MTIPDGSKPDLVFYYTIDNTKSLIPKLEIGNSIYQTFNGIISSTENLSTKIGKWSATNTIYNTNNSDNGLYKRTGLLSFFLPQGIININNTNPVIQNLQGSYVNIEGKYIFQIIGGNGDFLNYNGFIEIVYDNTTSFRKVSVYFDKTILNKVIDGSKPDLTFYYSVDNKSILYSFLKFDSSLLQTAIGNISSTPDILNTKIGTISTNITIYDFQNSDNDGIYEKSAIQIFSLPQGTISFINVVEAIKNSEGTFINSKNEYIFPILSGSGDYLNSTGYIVQLLDNITLLREIQVYFYK